MQKSPTIAQILGILSVIVIPLLLWGISVETRFTAMIYRIEQNEKTNAKIETKIDQINSTTMETLIQIEKLKK